MVHYAVHKSLPFSRTGTEEEQNVSLLPRLANKRSLHDQEGLAHPKLAYLCCCYVKGSLFPVLLTVAGHCLRVRVKMGLTFSGLVDAYAPLPGNRSALTIMVAVHESAAFLKRPPETFMARFVCPTRFPQHPLNSSVYPLHRGVVHLF